MKKISLKWEDIYESSIKFLLPLTPQETYQTIVKEFCKLLQADEGTVLSEKNHKLVRIYASLPEIDGLDVSLKGRTYQALHMGTPFSLQINSENDIQKDFYQLGFKTIIFIPFVYDNKKRGIVNVFSRKHTVLEGDSTLKLQLLGAMLSAILSKVEQVQAAENAVVSRDLFIATAAHELKTPLTSILMYSELVKKTAEERKRLDLQVVSSLNKQAVWLTKLMNELLQTKRILNRGEFNRKKTPVYIIDVLHLAVQIFSNTHKDRKLVIERNIKNGNGNTLMVQGDFYKLLQVYVNLLNNAAKYSFPETVIVFEIAENDGHIITKIKDQGVGIAKEELVKVFSNFYQGGHTKRDGLGLGLYLVKEIVENYDGTIMIDSELGRGTTVTVTFPKHHVT